MFERIVVPLDGSRFSASALSYAIEIAKQFGSEVTLIHVVTPTSPTLWASPTGMSSPEVTELAIESAQLRDKENVQRARRYLKRKLRQVAAQGVKTTFHVSIGSPAISIIEFCEKEKVDLVVMTTSGRSGIKRAILGSVADEVIREPGIPVLAIRPRKRGKK
jgi:nucleotide-binding universal stress UspA family protein